MIRLTVDKQLNRFLLHWYADLILRGTNIFHSHRSSTCHVLRPAE